MYFRKQGTTMKPKRNRPRKHQGQDSTRNTRFIYTITNKGEDTG